MMNKYNKIALIEISDLVNRKNATSGLGMAYIKSYLKSKDRTIDVNLIQEDIYSKVIEYKPDIIGISSISFFYENAIIFAKSIKKLFPSVKIIIGGAHITLTPKALDPVFDCGVIGEGEETTLELVNIFKDGKTNRADLNKVRGICYFDAKGQILITKRRDLQSNLDQFPNIPRSDKKFKKFILTSRGCPFNCYYCGSFNFWGSRKVKFHSAEYVFKDICNLSSGFYNEIDIADEAFVLDKSRLKKIVDLTNSIRRPWRNISFSCYLKSEFVDNETCDLLQKLNVKTVNLSLNSGSDRLLKLMNCSLSEVNQKAINCLHSWGFNIFTIFTFNNPLETEEDLLETEVFIKKNPFLFGMVRINAPFPGTQLYQKLRSRNITIDNPYLLKYKIENLDNISFESVSKLSIEKSLAIARRIDQIFRKKKSSKLLFLLKKVASLKPKVINFIKSGLYKSRIIFHLDFPKIVSIRITNKCNLNCNLCINANMRKTKEGDVSFEMAQRFLPDFKKYNPKIYLSGGEALLNKDFFKIAHLFKRAGLYVFTYSNGTLIKKYAKALLSTGIDSISISLYSSDHKIHDKITGIVGSFDKTISGIREIVTLEHKLSRINIATVINNQNYRHLADMYDYVESLGGIDTWDVFNISFINPKLMKKHVKRRGICLEMKDISGQLINREEYLLEEEIETLLEQLRIIKAKSTIYKTKIQLPNFKDGDFKNYYLGKPPSKNSKCVGVFEQLHIFNGYVNTWCGYRLSKIDDTFSIKKVWDSKKNIDFQKFILKNGVSTNCFRCTKIIYKF
jgi:anaerobic magnesium-protoporphyrin IX monomethyl ester cyclase